MNSFYGGQQGKNFKISEIFRNKLELNTDLAKRWQSSIGIGELVFISYGAINNDSIKSQHDINKQIDLDNYGKTYNSTLWQKIYTEKNTEELDPLIGIETLWLSKNYGFGYRLLAVLTGTTPKINVTSNIGGPETLPSVEIEGENDLENPILNFTLPRSAKYFYGKLLGLRINPDDDTNIFTLELIPELMGANSGDFYININTGFIYQCIELIGSISKWKFKACFATPEPDVKVVLQDPFTGTNGTNSKPKVELIYEDPENKINPVLKFYLNASPINDLNVITVGSESPAEITDQILNSTTKRYNISIPRGPKYFSGNKISDPDISHTIENTSEIADGAELGDWYISNNPITNGYMYRLILSDSLKVWKYQLNIAGPMGTGLQFTGVIIGSGNYSDSIANSLLEDILNPMQGDTYQIIFDDGTFLYTWNGMKWIYGGALTGSSIVSNAQIAPKPDDPDITSQRRSRAYSIEYIENLLSWNDF